MSVQVYPTIAVQIEEALTSQLQGFEWEFTRKNSEIPVRINVTVVSVQLGMELERLGFNPMSFLSFVETVEGRTMLTSLLGTAVYGTYPPEVYEGAIAMLMMELSK